jgi:hypothetical protein
MTTTTAEKHLRRVRLHLARDPDFPEGSREHGYDLVVPLDDKGRIEPKAWKALRDRCRVRRFWGGEKDEVGHVVHKPGGAWAFHYDIHGDPDHDETGFRFESHTFVPGEYVSLKEQDGVLRTFVVAGVVELD